MGILPLVIAIIVGLLIAARGQANAVKQNLSTAAEKTSAGLRIAAYTHLNALQRLAKHPRVVGALIPGPQGKPVALDSRQAISDVTDFLGRRSQGEPPENSISV